MLKLLTGIALSAALLLIGASASMNFDFAYTLGRTPREGMILGAVTVGVDVLKASLAVFIGYAAHARRWIFVVIGSIVFVLFSTLSLAAAFGFSAANRQGVIGERERGIQRLTVLGQQLGELRAKLSGLPRHRVTPLVDESLAAARMDPRWVQSRECTEMASVRVREFCQSVSQLRSERIAALEGARLEALIAEREHDILRERQAGNGLAPDPQARSIADALGLSEASVQRGLSALLALVIEVGSALGVYIALGHGAGQRREQRVTGKRGPDMRTYEGSASPPFDQQAVVGPRPETSLPDDAVSASPAVTPDAKSVTSLVGPAPGVAVGVRLGPRRRARPLTSDGKVNGA